MDRISTDLSLFARSRIPALLVSPVWNSGYAILSSLSVRLGNQCDLDENVAGELAWWFGLAAMLRLGSTGWDLVFSCLPFVCIRHCCPILYENEVLTEESHSVLGTHI